MAGRPVAVRGSLSGVHYGMIAFAVISVVSLGLFIFQLIKNKDYQDQARVHAERAKLAGTAPPYYGEVARAIGPGSTVFGVMEDDLHRLAWLVTGKREDYAPTVDAKARNLLADIAARKPGTLDKGDALLSALTTLDELHTKATDAAEAAKTAKNDMRDERDNLTAQLKSTRDEFEAQVKALSEQLKQSQDEKISALQQKDTQLTELQKTIDGLEEQLRKLKLEGNQLVRQRDIEKAQLERQNEALQKELSAVKPSVLDPNAILTKADGKILRAIPGSDVVYINLGRPDKIKVGMGFEVYSQTLEPRKTLRGKASLEVVNIMEESAECRVTRRAPGQPIIEGDIIVNIAFERNRVPKFVIRGDFDLNYDGIVDFDGPEQVASLIRQWGGQVVPELDESVDFVVIGLAPQVPTFAEGQPVSDLVADQANQKKLEFGQFTALRDRAQKMYIPVITQNQFLYLLGYAGDTSVVRR